MNAIFIIIKIIEIINFHLNVFTKFFRNGSTMFFLNGPAFLFSLAILFIIRVAFSFRNFFASDDSMNMKKWKETKKDNEETLKKLLTVTNNVAVELDFVPTFALCNRNIAPRAVDGIHSLHNLRILSPIRQKNQTFS